MDSLNHQNNVVDLSCIPDSPPPQPPFHLDTDGKTILLLSDDDEDSEEESQAEDLNGEEAPPLARAAGNQAMRHPRALRELKDFNSIGAKDWTPMDSVRKRGRELRGRRRDWEDSGRKQAAKLYRTIAKEERGGDGSQALRHSATNHKEDEDCFIVDSSGKNALADFPHAREDCVVFPRATNWNGIANRKFCNMCYCYVCDIPAKQCPKWDKDHCNARHKTKKWRNQREQRKTKDEAQVQQEDLPGLVGNDGRKRARREDIVATAVLSSEECVAKMTRSSQKNGAPTIAACSEEEDNGDAPNLEEYRLASARDLYTFWEGEEFHVKIHQRILDGKVLLEYPSKQKQEDPELEGGKPEDNYQLIMKDGYEDAVFDGRNGVLLDTEGEEIDVYQGPA